MFASDRDPPTRFRNRREAGRELAGHLTKYAHRCDVVVLGLPRGGVPVAYEVARALRAPLDVFVVRKLGVPGNRELAMGAIARGGVRELNQGVIDRLAVSAAELAAVTASEQRELERREHLYREGQAPPAIAGRTVIVVDDGIATGSTVRAATKALRHLRADRIVVATPTAAPEAAASIRLLADEFVALLTSADFFAVGQWYDDFAQTTDDDVRTLLAAARSPPARAEPA